VAVSFSGRTRLHEVMSYKILNYFTVTIWKCNNFKIQNNSSCFQIRNWRCEWLI